MLPVQDSTNVAKVRLSILFKLSIVPLSSENAVERRYLFRADAHEWKVKPIFKPREMPPCRDCEQEWTFGVLEQALYAERGYQNDPSRCKDCRDNRKSKNRPAANDGNYKGVCDECQGVAIVPFKPRSDRPLYCRSCFLQQRRTG